MRWQTIVCRGIGFVAAGMLWASVQGFACAQNNNNNNNNNNGGSSNGGSNQAGIDVDARGVVQTRSVMDQGGQVWRQRIAAARTSLGRDVLRQSPIRYVSLNRLEAAVQAKSGVATEEMRYLAGLQRVKYVFCYPDSKDIVIAGPAEGWASDATGRVLGLSTRRPVVQLQDLIVALRSFAPGGEGPDLIGCSIDPTQEGLAAMQQFIRSFPKTFSSPNEMAMVAPQFAQGLRNSLGMQVVSIKGVAPNTRFAQVLVEADYRMKLIGIGLEPPPVPMTTFIDKARPGASNSLVRWYFVPDYQCVRVCQDSLGMELVGDGVQLLGEEEMVASDGQRHRAGGKGNSASAAFTNSFTKVYPRLADNAPVYAELRNLVDLSVAAAFIQKHDYYGKSGWKMGLFGDESKFAVETFNTPKMVESTVNGVLKRSQFLAPIAGGVSIKPQTAVKPQNTLPDNDGRVGKVQSGVKLNLASGQWWWD